MLSKDLNSNTQTEPLQVVSGRPILIVTIIVSLTIAFMSSSLSISLPAINKEFTASPAALTWIITAYALAMAIRKIGQFDLIL